MIRRLRHKWEDLKMGWRLLFGGEVAILNAIDAIQTAGLQIAEPVLVSEQGDMHAHRVADIAEARRYMDLAVRHLKQVINYENEPAESDAVTRAELEDTISASWLP